jgi:hypothetical protein
MKGVPRPACAGIWTNAPQPGARMRARLAQRAGSGRIGLGQKRPAGEGRGERVVVDLRPELCRSDAELGRKIGCRSTAQAVAAARNSVAVPMLVMGWNFSGVVDVLFRAGLGMRSAQMQRSMGIAVGER